MKNYYEELGVASNADIAEIKKAYLALLKKYHPDLYKGDKNYAEAQTQKLNIIYNVLKDEQQRKKYDTSVGLVKQNVENKEETKTHETTVPSRRKADYDGGIFSGLKNRWANAFSYDYDEQENSTKNSNEKLQKNSSVANDKNKTNQKQVLETNKTNQQKNDSYESKQQKEKQKMTLYVSLVFGIIILVIIFMFIF